VVSCFPFPENLIFFKRTQLIYISDENGFSCCNNKRGFRLIRFLLVKSLCFFFLGKLERRGAECVQYCSLAEKGGDGREMSDTSHFFFYIDFGRDVNGQLTGL